MFRQLTDQILTFAKRDRIECRKIRQKLRAVERGKVASGSHVAPESRGAERTG